MQSVGTYTGDAKEHVKMPLSINTLCGMGISLDSIVDDDGYYKQEFPKPSEYASPCFECQRRVCKLEDLLNELCS